MNPNLLQQLDGRDEFVLSLIAVIIPLLTLAAIIH